MTVFFIRKKRIERTSYIMLGAINRTYLQEYLESSAGLHTQLMNMVMVTDHGHMVVHEEWLAP